MFLIIGMSVVNKILYYYHYCYNNNSYDLEGGYGGIEGGYGGIEACGIEACGMEACGIEACGMEVCDMEAGLCFRYN